MPFRRSFCLLLALIVPLSLWFTPSPATAAGGDPLAGDARRPPARPTLASADDPHPSLTQPSAFMAGHVAVQVIFVESDGSAEPSTENWTPDQISTIMGHIGSALDWWGARLPNARLSFALTSSVVGSRYEPITHKIDAEGLWIGDVLARTGFSSASYFDQAYAADDTLRRAQGADWGTTIFIANSAADDDGRFADGLFAYAYIGGPFLVLTSDVGAYGTAQLAPVATHELGHIFGALDQYASAATPCSQQSGYLAVPTTNSEAGGCGTHFVCIMLSPSAAYPNGEVDDSALGQIGYRDTDGDGIPDPIDTAPAAQFTITQPASGGRPIVAGRAADQPYPSASETPATINTIAHVEYRIDGMDWTELPASDGAYDNAVESITTTLPLYDGQYNVELRVINSVGTASPVISQSVTVSGVGAEPAYQVGAPALSGSTDITITLAAPDGSSAQISEDPFFSAAAWAPAPASASWRLRPTDGVHTVYVRFRDSNGLESSPFSRSIVLDRTPPTGRALIHGGDAPWLELQAQDSGSGVAAVQVGVGTTSGVWQPFQSSLPISPGMTNIQVRLRDTAGNLSAPITAQSSRLIYLPLVSRP
ncbi:MAG TPA: hypothetical protein VGJ87_09275 [Roseiflexaceae bacterium]|jgi:hypothetical protein